MSPGSGPFCAERFDVSIRSAAVVVDLGPGQGGVAGSDLDGFPLRLCPAVVDILQIIAAIKTE